MRVCERSWVKPIGNHPFSGYAATVNRTKLKTGAVVYLSNVLTEVDVPHAFTTRVGGVSTGVFASLNFGNPADIDPRDPPENLAANYRLVQEGIGCAERRHLAVRQVHGRAIHEHQVGHTIADTVCADAIITHDPLALATVRTADCVPILITCAKGRQVAAVHAGWRGVALNIIQETLAQFADPSTCRAAVGPCIGFDAFEVGPEVIQQMKPLEDIFRSSPAAGYLTKSYTEFSPATQKGHVDLRRLVWLQLIAAGLRVEYVDADAPCTFTDSEFYSHRRDQGRTGRMTAMIGVCSSARN